MDVPRHTRRLLTGTEDQLITRMLGPEAPQARFGGMWHLPAPAGPPRPSAPTRPLLNPTP